MSRYVNKYDHCPDDPEIVECYHCGRQLEVGTDDAWELNTADGDTVLVCDQCKKEYKQCCRCEVLFEDDAGTTKGDLDYCETCADDMGL